MMDEQIDGQHRLWAAWLLLVWCVIVAMLIGSLAILATAPPNKWEDAVVRGTCGGLPLLQIKDGTVWLRVNGILFYRVEDPDKLSCG